MADNKSCEVINRIKQDLKWGRISIHDLNNVIDEIGGDSERTGFDIANTLKGLKAIQREARKATASLKEFEGKRADHLPKAPLIQIELESIDNVPKVFYKGEEITQKIHVSFDWSTQTEKTVASPMINIEYADVTSKRINIKRISHNPLGGESL